MSTETAKDRIELGERLALEKIGDGSLEVVIRGSDYSAWIEPDQVPALRAYLDAHFPPTPGEGKEGAGSDLAAKLVPYTSHVNGSGPLCERAKHSDYPCTCGLEALLAQVASGPRPSSSQPLAPASNCPHLFDPEVDGYFRCRLCGIRELTEAPESLGESK